ncbi:zinc ABC transporter substrate-binding protein [Acidithiobacillus ferriphilus]|nr:zinc ABC transporter substrate-binding protein [Acidithiobacillus ferriphilus]
MTCCFTRLQQCCITKIGACLLVVAVDSEGLPVIPFNHQKALVCSMPNHCLRSRMLALLPRIALFVGLGMAQMATAATIYAVGVENEYADVIGQIGGGYVTVNTIESNPNTDPHTFEASPAVAREIAGAQIVVRNGVGYDGWAKKILASNPNPKRKVIVVRELLRLPESTKNPHLWYKPETMPAVALAVARSLTELDPGHAAYFAANVRKFDTSLQPWHLAIASFKAQFGGTPVAVTEPVANYLLQAAGCDIKTPWNLQAAVMNGTDPAPQDVSIQNRLIKQHSIKIFVYNKQVTDSLTNSFLSKAKAEKIPVVGVYETMPTGDSYQSWMLTETNALRNAVERGTLTTVPK